MYRYVTITKPKVDYVVLRVYLHIGVTLRYWIVILMFVIVVPYVRTYRDRKGVNGYTFRQDYYMQGYRY